MIELPCPICGARSVDEFRRLPDRFGPAGEVEERWWHVLGCRRTCVPARPADDLGAPGDRSVAPVMAPDAPWAPALDSGGPVAPLPRRKGAEPARLVPAPLDEESPSPAVGAVAAPGPTPAFELVGMGIGAVPAEPSPPGAAGTEGSADEVLVALPDAPPVPFERPEWPAGSEAEDVEPAPPSLPAAHGEDVDVDEATPPDRFRERRAAAQPVERAVRRPVGLVGPNQPRSVDVTRRPPVEHRPVQRQPGVEPRPAASAPPSLFARTRPPASDSGPPGPDEPAHVAPDDTPPTAPGPGQVLPVSAPAGADAPPGREVTAEGAPRRDNEADRVEEVVEAAAQEVSHR